MSSQTLPIVSNSKTRPLELDMILGSLGQELSRLEENILSDIQTDVELLNTVAEHILLSGGKRLRPALVMIGASLFLPVDDSIRRAAQVVEYLHTGTLLHDDVVDGAETRRARKAARRIWGNEASVLTGDYLLSKAFHMLTELRNLEGLRLMSRTTTLMAKGEILQLKCSIGEVDEKEYLNIIFHKTACLFGSAAQSGALLAGASSEEAECLRRYGEALGMAFQIVDDALDYEESPQTGKQAGTDLLERKITMPLIHLILNLNERDRRHFEKMLRKSRLGTEQVPKVIRMMRLNGSIEYSLNRARDYADAAVRETLGLSRSLDLTVLRQVAEYILSRNH